MMMEVLLYDFEDSTILLTQRYLELAFQYHKLNQTNEVKSNVINLIAKVYGKYKSIVSNSEIYDSRETAITRAIKKVSPAVVTEPPLMAVQLLPPSSDM